MELNFEDHISGAVDFFANMDDSMISVEAQGEEWHFGWIESALM